MRAAVYHGQRDLRIEEVAEAVAGPGEVKLQVQFAGICGTDVHEVFDGPIYTRTEPHPVSGVSNPVVLGHELSGIVVELGSGVTSVELGDLVCIDPTDACSSCHACTAGRSVFCAQATIHGYSRSSGAFSEFTVVTESMLHRIPDGITALQAALVEPMAVGRRAAKRTRAGPGDIVAVHGAGPVGLGVAFALRSLGARCVVIEPGPVRFGVARDLGFDVLDPTNVEVIPTLFDLTDGRGVAASVDAAGVPVALEASLASTAIGGTVVIVAVPSDPVELPTRLLRRAEAWITPSSGSSAEDFNETIAAMASGTYPLDEWVEIVALDDVVEEFERLHRGERVKVLIDLATSG